MNYLQELGHLAIASRLKNYTDILIRDVSQIYKNQSIDFEPRWFTTFYLLATKEELSVMEISGHLNQSHPAVNQVANALEKKGLIISTKKDHDGRKRYLKLSKKGNKLFIQLEPLWKNIEQTVIDYLSEIDPEFLDTLQKLENSLQEKSMYERINEHISKSEYKKIEIIDFKPELREYFAKLNFEWLETYFEVEDADRQILENPEKEILQKDGHVFFARYEGQIAGTAAILKKDQKTCELTKMAVTKHFQGKQIGKKLLRYSIDFAKKQKYESIILCTSPILVKAKSLYQSFGFVDSTDLKSTEFNLKRGCNQMELKLNV